MKNAKLHIQRLSYLPWLLVASVVLAWAGEATAQAASTDSVGVTLSPTYVREDGGAKDITITAKLEVKAKKDLAVYLTLASPSADYVGKLFTIDITQPVIKKGEKEGTGTITVTPIDNDWIGTTKATTENTTLDIDRVVFDYKARGNTAFSNNDSLTKAPNLPILLRVNADASYPPGATGTSPLLVKSDGGWLFFTLIDDEQFPSAINLSFDPSKLSKQADATSIEVTGTLDGGRLRGAALKPRLVVTGSDTLKRDEHYTLSGLGELTIPSGQASGTKTITLNPNGTKDGALVIGPSSDTDTLTAVISKRTHMDKNVRVDVNGDGTIDTSDSDNFAIPSGTTVKETLMSEEGQNVRVTWGVDFNGDNKTDGTIAAGTLLVEKTLGIDFTGDGDYLDVYKVPSGGLKELGLQEVTGSAFKGRIDFDGDGKLDGTHTTGTLKYVTSLAFPVKVNTGTITIEADPIAKMKSDSFKLDPAMIRENAGATDVTMTVELATALNNAQRVDFEITPGAGTRDEHYTVQVTEGLTIPAGDTKGTATMRVTPVNNSDKNAARTFTVKAKIGDDTSQMQDKEFKITDDETLSENITLKVSPSEIKEDAGETTVTVTGTLDGKVLDADATITLGVDATPDKSAARDLDYTVVLRSLTIPQGEVTGSTTITVTPVADETDDNDETITLKSLTDLKNQDSDKITVASVAIKLKEPEATTTTTTTATTTTTTTATTTGPTFGTDALAFEATVGRAFSAVLPEATGGEGTLMYSVSTALPAGLSFDATTRTISGTPTMAGMSTVLYVAVDDDDGSGTKTFTITVSEPPAVTVGVDRVTASQSAVREDGETAEIRITVTLSQAAPSAEMVRFTIVPPASGTMATRDVDYTATLVGTITIAAGDQTGSTTLLLSPIDNDEVDGHRYLGVRAAASGSWSQADLRISDDETPSASVVVSVMPRQLSESADLTEVQVMVELDGKPLAEAATATILIDETSPATRDTDYSALFNPTITIAAGSIAGSTTLLIDPVADTMTEGDEEIRIKATLPGLTEGSATLVLTETDSGMMDGDKEMMQPLAFVSGIERPTQSYTAGTAIQPLVLPAALGGEGAITYRVSDLPAGLSFDAATRTISGTPEAATDGAVSVTYTATAGDESLSLMFTITINPMLDFGDLNALFGLFNGGAAKANPADSHDDSSLQLTVGVPVDLTLPAVSGGTPPLMYSVSGLPAGLSFDPATRMISGMPDMAGKSVITYTVTDASGATRSLPVSVSVMEPPLAAPTNLMAEDYKGADGQGDQGGFVMLSWELSADHASLDGYRIFRALPVLGNEMVPWALVDAVPGVATGRAIVATLDNVSTRWGIAAESGGRTTHTMAKAVFVEADDLTAPYVQMAETLAASRAAAQAGEGPVMASLLPDALAYAEGVAPKLNVVGGVLSSSITWTAEAVGATDDIAPLAVPSLRVLDAPDDAGGRLALTWSLSPSDQLVQGVVAGAIGPAPVAPIVGVHGYRIYRRAAGEEAFSLVAEVAAGMTSFVDETALNGVHYTYQVRPFDWDNEPGAEVEQTALAVRNRAVDRQGRVLLGLFGADGRIGFDDFFLLADQFGLTAEDAGFDPAFDLAPNATIDFDDFFVLADHFGRRLASAGKPVPLRAGLNGDARLYLDAPTALPSVGEDFVVAVRWSDLAAVQGYGLQVGYDADKLSFVSVQTDQPLGSSAFAAPQVLADQAGVLTVVAHGDAVSDGELGLRLVFRPTTEIEGTTLEITDNQTYDNALGFNRLALPAPVSLQTRPAVFSLADNYPNPFNPATTLQYALPQAADVALTVYNVLGQPVRTLVAERQAAGRYAVEWDATNDQGHRLSSGLYFYRLQAGGDFREVKKMLLLK